MLNNNFMSFKHSNFPLSQVMMNNFRDFQSARVKHTAQERESVVKKEERISETMFVSLAHLPQRIMEAAKQTEKKEKKKNKSLTHLDTHKIYAVSRPSHSNFYLLTSAFSVIFTLENTTVIVKNSSIESGTGHDVLVASNSGCYHEITS